MRKLVTIFAMSLTMVSAPLLAQTPIPDWCRALPRRQYKSLERFPVSDAWFEVYKPVPGVFAIYEPHQAEETIGYLIVGQKRALLFDTGMGIGDIKKITAELTKLPIIVLNSHTHDDHVGGNWEFDTVYEMNTDFTRKNAQGSREDAQAEITSDQDLWLTAERIRSEGLRDSSLENQGLYPRWGPIRSGRPNHRSHRHSWPYA